MSGSPLVPLDCDDAALDALERGVKGIARDDNGLDWMVGTAFIETCDATFVISASVEILGDGTVARPLSIRRPAALLQSIRAAQGDIRNRMAARGSHEALPDVGEEIPIPPMSSVFEATESCGVVVRSVVRKSGEIRIACGLLVDRQKNGSQVLVGTDLTTLALVYSEDAQLIAEYLADCEVHDLARYRKLIA